MALGKHLSILALLFASTFSMGAEAQWTNSTADRLKCRIYGEQTGHREASKLSAQLHPKVQKQSNDALAKLKPGEDRSQVIKRIQFWRNEEIIQVGQRRNQVQAQAQKQCERNPKAFVIESTEIDLYAKYPIHDYFEGPRSASIQDKSLGAQ